MEIIGHYFEWVTGATVAQRMLDILVIPAAAGILVSLGRMMVLRRHAVIHAPDHIKDLTEYPDLSDTHQQDITEICTFSYQIIDHIICKMNEFDVNN